MVWWQPHVGALCACTIFAGSNIASNLSDNGDITEKTELILWGCFLAPSIIWCIRDMLFEAPTFSMGHAIFLVGNLYRAGNHAISYNKTIWITLTEMLENSGATDPSTIETSVLLMTQVGDFFVARPAVALGSSVQPQTWSTPR